MRHVSAVLVFAAAAGMVGCGQFGSGTGSSAKGGIAVVDLDKVAADTGRDRQLAQSLETAQNSLNQSYQKQVESAKTQLDAKKKEYGEEISDSEKREFAQLEQSAVNQLTKIQKQAQADFMAYKEKQILRFRAELKPIAQEIAAKRGLGIVIPKNEGLLLSVDPGVDITEDVVKALRERHPVPATTSATETTSSAAQSSQSTAPRRKELPSRPAGSNRAASSSNDEDSPR